MSWIEDFSNSRKPITQATLKSVSCLHLCDCGNTFAHAVPTKGKTFNEILQAVCERDLLCETCFIRKLRAKLVPLRGWVRQGVVKAGKGN